MGLNVGANVMTSGGLGITMVLLLLAGILLVSASNKLKQLPEFNSSSELRNGFNNLKTAYYLLFIAAAIALILTVLYGGHESAWCSSEWIHGVLYFLMYVAVIIGVIYAYVVLNNIYNPELENNNGSAAFIWAALLVSALAFISMTATGAGRIGYGVARNHVTQRVRHAEHKIHETHSSVTGMPNDFPGHTDRCTPDSECGVAMVPVIPAGTVVYPPAPVPVARVPSSVTVTTTPMNNNVRLPPVPVSAYALPGEEYQTVNGTQYMGPTQGYVGTNLGSSQSVAGPKTVTRHSVVTTSQPVVTMSSPRPAASPMRMALPQPTQSMSALAQSVNQDNFI